jgi:hypothetical protein
MAASLVCCDQLVHAPCTSSSTPALFPKIKCSRHAVLGSCGAPTLTRLARVSSPVRAAVKAGGWLCWLSNVSFATSDLLADLDSDCLATFQPKSSHHHQPAPSTAKSDGLFIISCCVNERQRLTVDLATSERRMAGRSYGSMQRAKDFGRVVGFVR